MNELGSIQEEEKSTEVTTSKTKSSSKKKRKKNDSISGDVTSEDITAQYDGSVTKNSSKKKRNNDKSTPQKKQKKQKSSSPSVDPHSMPSPDQVISPQSSDADEAPSSGRSGSRHVSFGKMNQCKSHKASMKAIKTLNKERWDTTTRTPEKGILSKTPLRSKSSENVKKSSKKKKRSTK